MELGRTFAELTKKQQTQLCKALVKLKKHAPTNGDTLDTVSQVVTTMHGYHWLGIIYQDINNVVDGNFSLHVSCIGSMVCDYSNGDVPMCSNIEYMVIEHEGELWIKNNDLDGNEDEEGFI